MVCGLDLHRGQITFDALEVETGELWRGRIQRPDRVRFRRWLTDELAPRANGDAALAVEGCTGWRYVVEEIVAVGMDAHMAEPADTQAARGRKGRAKTDRSDARLLRELLYKDELPESWIPPEPVLEWRERGRLYKTLLDQRREWIQRIHAELYQHGVSVPEDDIDSAGTRVWLFDGPVILSPAGRQRVRVGYHMIDAINDDLGPSKQQLQRFGRRQPACQALAKAHYGIGSLTAVIIWSELGDCQRFSNSDQVVRHTGLDVHVDASDQRRAGGYLCRQGPPTLRWALFEAAIASARPTAPDHDYYQAVRKAHDGKLAGISMARKLARRCYHTLRTLDPALVYAMPTD
jgi:transposase